VRHFHNNPSSGRNRRGFTLIELLVVVTIVILVSAVALAVVPGLAGNYQVTEGARIVQAAFAGARDAANRYNANRGVRLMPDPSLSDPINFQAGTGGKLVINRLIPIEPAPDLTEGMVTFPPMSPFASFNDSMPYRVKWGWNSGVAPSYPNPLPSYLNGTANKYPFNPPLPSGTPPLLQTSNPILMVMQSTFKNNDVTNPNPLATTTYAVSNSPTNWFWNVRIGDKLRFNDSGQYYTVVGPMTVKNPEYFVNIGNPGATPANSESLLVTYTDFNNPANQFTVYPEFLFLVNGIDDNNNGFVDEGFNNVDENLDGIVDDLGEWLGKAQNIDYSANVEKESWLGDQLVRSKSPLPGPNPLKLNAPQEFPYTIVRRPVPSPGARETLLPSSVVIDLTTYDLPRQYRERSRLPDLNPYGGYIDILLNPSGQVVPTTLFSTPAASSIIGDNFYHFWIADRSDVYPANVMFDPTTKLPNYPSLPLPESIPGYQPSSNPALTGVFLKKDRQLVTLYTRTGQIVTNSINNFQLLDPVSGQSNPDPNRPYFEAQQGIREAK